MTITSNEALRSITNEAGRQAEYFHRRNMPRLAEVWSELQALAFQASREGTSLLIVATGEKDSSPIPIKACEQGVNPHNHNVIKPFQ